MMPIHVPAIDKNTLNVDLGHIQVSSKRLASFNVERISTGILVVLFDRASHVGGCAHILLPDTEISNDAPFLNPKLARPQVGAKEPLPAHYANEAIPALWEKLERLGANESYTSAKLIGGSQLFNFGGGNGNPLNLGSRNAIVCRTLLTRLGIEIDKTDVGGNRIRSVYVSLRDGNVYVTPMGQETVLL